MRACFCGELATLFAPTCCRYKLGSMILSGAELKPKFFRRFAFGNIFSANSIGEIKLGLILIFPTWAAVTLFCFILMVSWTGLNKILLSASAVCANNVYMLKQNCIYKIVGERYYGNRTTYDRWFSIVGYVGECTKKKECDDLKWSRIVDDVVQ